MELEGFAKEEQFASNPILSQNFSLEKVTLYANLALELLHEAPDNAAEYANSALLLRDSIASDPVGEKAITLRDNIYDCMGVLLRAYRDNALNSGEVKSLDELAVKRAEGGVSEKAIQMRQLDPSRFDAYSFESSFWNRLGTIELQMGQNENLPEKRRKLLVVRSHEHFEKSRELQETAVSKVKSQISSFQEELRSNQLNPELASRISDLEKQMADIVPKLSLIRENISFTEQILKSLEDKP